MPRITNALNSPFLISITSVIVSGIVALGASTLFAQFVTRNKKIGIISRKEVIYEK